MGFLLARQFLPIVKANIESVPGREMFDKLYPVFLLFKGFTSIRISL